MDVKPVPDKTLNCLLLHTAPSDQRWLNGLRWYSGIYGRASINFYAFNTNGNKGIACGLNNLQKLRDGEPLGGKSRAEDDFADDDDDDFLS